MSYHLNIRMDNIPVSDMVAKTISLSLRGLTYAEIEKVLKHKDTYIRNEVSRYYSLLGTPHCVNGLNYYALHHGFDFNGHVGDVPLLCDYELYRLLKYVPRLGQYHQLKLQFAPF